MAKTTSPKTPLTVFDPVEAGFLDARGKLIEVAAFFDRVERRRKADNYRVQALYVALKKLTRPDERGQRAASVLRALSDPTQLPVPCAGSPASGAWKKQKATR